MELEIWSDIACPWCYVGKRRIESALGQFDHASEVNVTWRSFELDPTTPKDVPGSAVERIAAKYGMTPEQAQEAQERLTGVAAEDGLEYHLDRQRMGNTFDGHRVIHLAAEHGLQDAMEERLFRARFIEGQQVSDHEFLVAAAVEVGVPEDEVREVLNSDRFAAEVRADEQLAQQFGISGVPMFVVDRKYGASGAQPPEQLVALLQHGWENREPEPLQQMAGGESCGVDGC
jgi:predicted DsbA family dithiol-disulfide isomerase